MRPAEKRAFLLFGFGKFPSPSFGPAFMTDSRRSTTSALALCTLFLMAFAMRGPVTSVGPAADVVLRDFGLSYQAFGVLNALPVLAFGLFSFPAVTLSERIGMHKTIAARFAA